MEGGAAERDALLRRQMEVMPPDRFEQLIFELAHREDPAVRRLQHPDGGADTLRPAAGGLPAVVWQAKRYPGAINWKECEDSLDSAIERFKPAAVIFAFPRDLSQQLEKSFETRLVQRTSSPAAPVEVGLWNRSEIVRRLAEHPDLRATFFGPEQNSVMVTLDRMIKAGGKLESGHDLVERARTLGEYAQQQDVDFDYRITSGPATAPAPNWDELPYMTLAVGDERIDVHVSTWVAEGADVPPPTLHFVDTEAGQHARMEAVRALARGEVAQVTEGARLALHAPQVMRDLMPDPRAMGAGTATPNPGEPVDLGLAIETEEGQLERQLQMRPVPPRPGAAAAFAGYSGAVLVEVNFTLMEQPRISANLSFSARFGDSARENADAAELLYGFHSHTRLTLRSTAFFPETGELAGRYAELTQAPELERMEWMRRFYADLALLEKQLSIRLPQPQEMTVDDIDAVGTAAQVLRTGEGSATFGQAEGFVQNPSEIPRLPDEFRRQEVTRRMVSYPIFGQEVELGMAEYELPPLKVVNIVPHGQTPEAPARVVLEAEGDGQIRFRLLDWEPPDEDR